MKVFHITLICTINTWNSSTQTSWQSNHKHNTAPSTSWTTPTSLNPGEKSKYKKYSKLLYYERSTHKRSQHKQAGKNNHNHNTTTSTSWNNFASMEKVRKQNIHAFKTNQISPNKLKYSIRKSCYISKLLFYRHRQRTSTSSHCRQFWGRIWAFGRSWQFQNRESLRTSVR